MSDENGQATVVKKQKTFNDLLKQMEPELRRAMPKHMDPGRLVRIVLTLMKQNPKLRLCTNQSITGAIFMCASLGLEPIGGQAFFVPFKNKKGVLECQFIVGYKGYITLFYRHESSLSITMNMKKEGDIFDYRFGTDAYLNHVPKGTGTGKATHFYSLAKLANGEVTFDVMTLEECLAHARKHSKAWDAQKKRFYPGSSWADSPESMCMKTVMLRHAKGLPLSYEMHRAIEADESVRHYKPGAEDFIELPDTAWENGDSEETESEPELKKEPPKQKKKKDESFGGKVTDEMRIELHEEMKAHFGSEEAVKKFISDITSGRLHSTSGMTAIDFYGIKEAFEAEIKGKENA